MRVSTKGRYALRLLLDLAVNGKEEGGGLSKVFPFAKKYPTNTWNKLLTSFVKPVMLKAHGEQMEDISFPSLPEYYTVGMILQLMEGTLSPVPCLDFLENDCHRAPRCATVELWQELKEAVEEVVNRVTLADLVKRDLELNPPTKVNLKHETA